MLATCSLYSSSLPSSTWFKCSMLLIGR
jgi:hypothetical protein